MFPASSKMNGMCQATPDVCKVPAPPAPPVPTPFPNMAQLAMANGATCAKKVKIMNQPVVTKATQIPMSQGDEAGVAGGVVSSMNMNQAAFKKGSTKVKVEGNPIIMQMETAGQNGSNANQPGGMQASPSQTKVMVGS